ncbi:MAG: hypothetical protein J0647_06105 [Campylobacteraceae bacterium]|nr:hypothetical protein [Campylobacteraceae bacterium]
MNDKRRSFLKKLFYIFLYSFSQFTLFADTKDILREQVAFKIAKKLNYLKLDKFSLKQFSIAYINEHKLLAINNFNVEHAASHFLLSSDFFESAQNDRKIIMLKEYYNPYSGCTNSIARFL